MSSSTHQRFSPKTNKKHAVDENVKIKHSEIDAIRGMAITCLLLLHTSVAKYLDLGLIKEDIFIEIIYSGTVTLFIFLAGLGNAIQNRNTPLNVKKYLTKRFRYLIPTYLIWGSLYFVMFNIGGWIYENGNLNSSLKIIEFAKLCFFALISGSMATLWFLPTIAVLYCFFVIIQKLYNHLNPLQIWIFCFTYSIFVNIVINSVLMKILVNIVTFERFNLVYLFSWINYGTYFIIGISIGYNWEKVKEIIEKNGFIGFNIIVLTILAYFIVMNSIFIKIMTILSLLVIVFNKKLLWDSNIDGLNIFQKYLLYNCRYSSGIFVVHRIFTFYLLKTRYILWESSYPRHIFLFICVLEAFFVYIGSILLVKKIKAIFPTNSKYIIMM